MVLSVNFIKDIQRDLDASIRPQLEAYNEPSFAKGEAGTLHAARTDTNGYKFLRIRIFGSPKVKVKKGCTAHFTGPGTDFTLTSDTKDIESYYSKSMQKGITEFEFYLDKDALALFKQPVEHITLNFGKSGLFKQMVYEFDAEPVKLAAHFKEKK